MVIAVSMMKDEADIAALTVGHMLTQVDHVIVADNGSTDGTREILESLPITVVDDPEVGYYQSRKMSALASQAREAGADWVVPFDADEVWYSHRGTISELLTSLPPEADFAEAVLFDHVPTALDSDADPIRSTPWRRTAATPLRKVACRAREGLVIHQGNHSAEFPTDRAPLTVTGQLEVRHFPYRSAAQMIRKAKNGGAAYEATDLPEDAGKHWRDYKRLIEGSGEGALAGVFRDYFWSPDPENDPNLINDPCPLQS